MTDKAQERSQKKSMTEFFKNSQKNVLAKSDPVSGKDTNAQEAAMKKFMTSKVDEMRDSKLEESHGHHVSPGKSKKFDIRSAYSQKHLSEKDKERLFLDQYDENTKLKETQSKIDQQMKELKTRIRVMEGEYNFAKKKYEGDQLIRADLEFISELKSENALLKQQLKDQHMPKPMAPGRGGTKVLVKSTHSKGPSRASNDQLRLIDMLKDRNRRLDQEVKDLQQKLVSRAGTSHMQESHHINNSRMESLKQGYDTHKHMYEKTRANLDDINQQLMDERRKSTELEIRLRTAEAKSSEAKELQKMLDDAKHENRMLEAKIKDLTSSPFFKDMETVHPARMKAVEDEMKEYKAKYEEAMKKIDGSGTEYDEMKLKLKLAEEDRDRLKEQKLKLEAVLEERDRNGAFMDDQMKMFNLGNQRDRDNFLKALGVVRLKGEEPAWKRIEFIDRHESFDPSDINSVLKEVDRLRIEKSEIAAQLEKTQTLLQTHLEIEKEKEGLYQAEVKKLDLQLKSANSRIDELVKLADIRAKSYRDIIASKGGAFEPYEDDADDFSEITESDIHVGENTFDILVSDCTFNELELRRTLDGKVVDFNGLQTVAALDFYNHDTQTSAICEGLEPSYQFQVAYKVSVDEALISYMQNSAFKVEVFACVGSDLVFVGNCTFDMRELLLKNYDMPYGKSAVASVTKVILGERQTDHVGTLKVKMRLRHPITDALRMLKEKEELMRDGLGNVDMLLDPTLKSRKLVIQIQKAVGLPSQCKSFVFFKFYNMRDTSTATIPGSDPYYNHVVTFDVPQNQGVNTYLSDEQLELVIFDDNVPLKVEAGGRGGPVPTDIIGTTKVRLSALLKDEVIDQALPVFSLRGGRVGTLAIKVYWHDTDIQKAGERDNLTRIWEDNITRLIAQAMAQRGQTLETAFLMLDADEDGFLTFDEFRYGITRIFRCKIPEDEISMYWSRLNLYNKKWTKEEFFMKYQEHLSSDANLEVTKNRLRGIDQISQLNKMLDNNTKQLRIGVESFENFIKQLAYYTTENGFQVDTVIQSFDRDRTGNISRVEIQGVIHDFKLQITRQQLDELLEYLDLNKDGRLQMREFSLLVKPELEKEILKQKQQAATFRPDEKKEIFRTVTKFIYDYLRKRNITVQQLASNMDVHGDGEIDRKDFTGFFKNIGVPIQAREENAFFGELAGKNQTKIEVRRFIELIQPYIDERPTITSSIKENLRQIALYLKKNNKDPYSFFNQVDTDKSGFLDRKELRSALVTIGWNSSSMEAENLLNYFDYGGDNRVSIKEFSDALEPYMKGVTIQRKASNLLSPRLMEIKRKLGAFVKKNHKNLEDTYGLYEVKKNFVSKNDFKTILQKYHIDLTISEMQEVLDNLVDYEDENIDYVKFLKYYKDYSADGDLAQSQIISSEDRQYGLRRSTTGNVFKMLRNVLSENNINPKDAFTAFDKNGDGKISETEFRSAFDQMKINLSDKEINDIMRSVDKTKDGNINYKEFIHAIQNAK